MILNGVYMNDKSLEKYKKDAFNNIVFNKVIEAIQDFKTINRDSLVVDFAYEGDILTKDDTVVSGRQINFINKEKNAQVIYRDFDNYDLPVELISIAHFIDSNEGKLVSIRINENEEIVTEIINENYSSKQIINEKEELPNNPDYLSQKGNVNLISPQAWWTGDGCLPGGYQHCGGNCGYPPRKYGGGTPINETDRCCVLHDSCYASNAKNCSCDTMLKQCTRLHSTWAAIGIQIHFKGC